VLSLLLFTWPEIRDIEPIFRQRLTALKLKMAATKRLSTRVDYAQLDNLSSVVLYDTSAPRKKKGKIYEVERMIGRKKEKHVSIKLKLLEIAPYKIQSQLFSEFLF
jgi:hypothetical protein